MTWDQHSRGTSLTNPAVGAVSLALHAAVIFGAIGATLKVARRDAVARTDTTVVFLEAPRLSAPPPPVQLDVPLQGFQAVVVPAVIPADIPPINLQQPFDPRDFSGIGVEGGHASGVAPPQDEVYTEAIVDEKPLLLSAPPPPYPALLSAAGIQGRVVLQAVVDTTGRLEPGSLKILETPNPGFNTPVKQWALKALFRPAMRQGRAVRVYVNLPLDYSAPRPGS
jgi:TonB family protein